MTHPALHGVPPLPASHREGILSRSLDTNALMPTRGSAREKVSVVEAQALRILQTPSPRTAPLLTPSPPASTPDAQHTVRALRHAVLSGPQTHPGCGLSGGPSSDQESGAPMSCALRPRASRGGWSPELLLSAPGCLWLAGPPEHHLLRGLYSKPRPTGKLCSRQPEATIGQAPAGRRATFSLPSLAVPLTCTRGTCHVTS